MKRIQTCTKVVDKSSVALTSNISKSGVVVVVASVPVLYISSSKSSRKITCGMEFKTKTASNISDFFDLC